MVKRNKHLEKLQDNYLFPEISKKQAQFQKEVPHIQLIRLGIGDTTLPLPSIVAKEMEKKASRFCTKEGYSGYGEEQGSRELRSLISHRFYDGRISADEIFVSDGAKCDIGRLQLLFGSQMRVAVQDPTYPVYYDGSLLYGVETITKYPCTAKNAFFPDFSEVEPVDLLYICHPNNPTGVAYSYEQLETLVSFAKENQSIIIFDTAYASFIHDANIPKSIYEIEGAETVAIEVSSFSKCSGFTGVRLGWTVVPKELTYDDGRSVQKDWKRVFTTIFNGASKISQEGGIAALKLEGWKESKKQIEYYLENTHLLKRVLTDQGMQVYGGEHAPYLWVSVYPYSSWQVFDLFLKELGIVVTPGVGFGAEGEHYIRISGFGDHTFSKQAAKRLQKLSFFSWFKEICLASMV